MPASSTEHGPSGATPTAQLPEPIVLWPSWGQPFAQTMRGAMCKRYTTAPRNRLLLILLLLLAVPVWRVIDSGAPPRAVMISIVVAALLVAFPMVLQHWFWIRPVLPFVRAARALCEPWRLAWLEFEQAAVWFGQQLRNNQAIRPDIVYQMCPDLPMFWIDSQRQATHVATDRQLPRDQEATLEARLGTMVVAVSAVVGAGTLLVGRIPHGFLALVAVAPTCHASLLVQYNATDRWWIPRIQWGIYAWTRPTWLTTGEPYYGDVAKYCRKLRPHVFGPNVNRVVGLSNQCYMARGDSSDVAMLNREKWNHTAGKFLDPVLESKDVRQHAQAESRKMLLAVEKVLGIKLKASDG